MIVFFFFGTGLFMVFCTDKGNRVAIFEIVKGATDFFIAMILWRDVKWHCCKYFRMVLVLASEILMGFGMSLFYIVLVLLILNTHVQ
jgi:hypothetical protein